jgi:hypothetical protein
MALSTILYFSFDDHLPVAIGADLQRLAQFGSAAIRRNLDR